MIICFQFDFIYFVQFNLHVIGRKVNLQVVVFKGIKFDKKSFWTFSFDFFHSIWGVCPTRRVLSYDTEANHANICLIVDCFRGEIHQSREAGPSERPQPEARRPLAQSRPPTAPQKNSRPSRTQFFIPVCLPNHTSTDQVTTSLTRSIAVSGSLLAVGLWGGASPPTTSQER